MTWHYAPMHQQLEEALAAFAGAPSALVFSSGYLANLAAVTALAAALGDVVIVSDELNHASLIDGCRLARGSGASGARLQVTPHGDVRAVRAALAGRRERAALVVTDAVFSVAGDLAPLAGQGGAVLGAPEVTGTLVDTGRGFIFDTGLAPPAVAAALAALQVLLDDPGRGTRAHEAAARLAQTASAHGLTVTEPDAAVAAVIMGDPGDALRAQRIFAAHGVRAGCFRPPSVPHGQACLRLTGRATLTEDDFATASRALAAVRDHCRIAAQAGGKTP